MWITTSWTEPLMVRILVFPRAEVLGRASSRVLRENKGGKILVTLGFGLLRRHCVWWDMTLQVGLPGSPVVMLFMAALRDFFFPMSFYWFDVPPHQQFGNLTSSSFLLFWVILMELFGFNEISKRFTWIARLCHCGSFLRLWRCAGASTTCA